MKNCTVFVLSLTLIIFTTVIQRNLAAKPVISQRVHDKAENINNDYCHPELCPKKKKHVACNNSTQFDSTCPENATQIVDMSQFRGGIIGIHNDYRNKLAGGKVRKLPPAARMASMTWSNELAQVASFNAKNCESKRDECHITPNFPISGQNIAVINTTESKNNTLQRNDYQKLIKKSLNSWWKESKNITVGILQSYPKNVTSQVYRNFAVMAWQNNTHVGCAATHFTILQIQYFKFVCNYATDYIPNQPVYTFRSIGCRNGYDKKMRFLCSKNEKF